MADEVARRRREMWITMALRRGVLDSRRLPEKAESSLTGGVRAKLKF